MDAQLQQKTKYWMDMERSTEQQRQAAELYYNEQLMPLIVQSFIERQKDVQQETPAYMILSVGTSYEPLVLSIALMMPRKVLFLYTDDTEKELDKIVDFLKMKPSQYEKKKVDKTNSLIIYQAIKDTYVEWGKPKSIYTDFTGGTKAMAAATAMAGAILGTQLIYIGNKEYLGQFRKPMPGTECLQKIHNPYLIFGDLEADKAFDLYAQHDYAGAGNIFESLYDRVPDAKKRQYFRVMYLLVSSYKHWDSLELKDAFYFMNMLVKELEKDWPLYRDFVLMDQLEQLKKQESILGNLAKILDQVKNKTPFDVLLNQQDIIPLMFTIYKNALRRKEQRKHDMASLLLYRLLEMMMQRRMAVHKIYVEKPEYERCFGKPDKMAEFKNKVADLRRQLYGSVRININLPDNISLMEGYIQLAVLQDPLIGKTRPIGFLKTVFQQVKVRNLNIFAHGFKSITKQEFESFEAFVAHMFTKFCNIEQVDMEVCGRHMTFVNIDGFRF